jgi:hypothetical protein
MTRRLSLLAALALIGCSGAGPTPEPQPQPQPQPQPLQPAIALSAAPSGFDVGLVGTSFDFMNLRDLWVRITVPGMPRVAHVHLTLTNPLGARFYETNLMYSADPTMQSMPMPSVDHPVTVFAASTLPGGFAIDVPVPVAGTVLTRYPMVNSGTWTAEADVDGLASSLSIAFQVQ